MLELSHFCAISLVLRISQNEEIYASQSSPRHKVLVYIHARGEGDMRDRMRGVNGQGMFRGAPNGRFHDDHRYKMSIKPEPYDGGRTGRHIFLAATDSPGLLFLISSLESHLFCCLVLPNLNLNLCIKAA
jgi:hypothetical protein